MTVTTDNTMINTVIAVSLFFILLPFVMILMDKENSKFKVLLVIAAYVAILVMFYTGYIYTTPVGKWIKQMVK